MCTVSVVPFREGFRIACNRDERLTRPAAEPPAERRAGARIAVWPRDPLGGGTWIGANDAGLAMFVLNRTPRAPRIPAANPRSRGTIIPVLLASREMIAAVEAAIRLPAAEFEPFTLVILRGAEVFVLVNADGRITARRHLFSRPLVFTSSSLGDHLVAKPRRALFAKMVVASPTPVRAQAAFHLHRWQSKPEISVLMARPGSATVSLTTLDVVNDRVCMNYRALGQ